jgi:hypothetical protein
MEVNPRGVSLSVSIETQGAFFPRTIAWLERLRNNSVLDSLDEYGQRGVDALVANTPVDDGSTAAAWRYVVNRGSEISTIQWVNDEVVDGTPLVILLQYGHGTGTGGYVQGRDFINPAMLPVFLEILDDVRKELTR